MNTRLLLIGLGRFGKQHLRVLVDLGVPLGLVDVDRRALDEARKVAPEARWARDASELMGDAFAASIVVPAPLHRPIATTCLEAGLAVLCEKPLAPVAEDARALAALAHTRGAVLQTGFIFRYHPATLALMHLVSEGAIGKPHTLRARFAGFKRPRTDGGCAMNDAVHFADLASLVFGKPPLRASGVVRDFLGSGHEDTAFIALDHGPELAHIEASYHAPDRARSVLVVGDRGSIAVDYDAEAPVTLYRQSHLRDGLFTACERAGEPIPVERREPLRAEIEDFLANARSGRPPAADGWAGARATAAIEAALVSAMEGRPVAVPRVGP